MAAQTKTAEVKPSSSATPPPVTSFQTKKSEDATFLQDVRDHIDEFVHASMDAHKNCSKKTMQKMFGISKVVEKNAAEAQDVESFLHLRTPAAGYNSLLRINTSF